MEALTEDGLRTTLLGIISNDRMQQCILSEYFNEK